MHQRHGSTCVKQPPSAARRTPLCLCCLLPAVSAVFAIAAAQVAFASVEQAMQPADEAHYCNSDISPAQVAIASVEQALQSYDVGHRCDCDLLPGQAARPLL